jgi:hypothetical protein
LQKLCARALSLAARVHRGDNIAAAEVRIADRDARAVLDDDRVAHKVEAVFVPLVVEVGEAVVDLAEFGEVDGHHELRGRLRVARRRGAEVHQAVTSRWRIRTMPATTKIAQ